MTREAGVLNDEVAEEGRATWEPLPDDAMRTTFSGVRNMIRAGMATGRTLLRPTGSWISPGLNSTMLPGGASHSRLAQS